MRTILYSFITLVIIALGAVGWGVASAQTSWYDSDWEYRKSHTINAGSGAGSDYQIELDVNYGSGTDTGNTVYLNSNSNTDFSDIRFTSADGTTELDYWIESKTDGSSATVWVEVADNLDSNQDIYLYYGNAGATSSSDIKDTFVQAVDFATDTVLSYGGTQDSTDTFATSSTDNYIRFGLGTNPGNNWKAVDVGALNITSGDYILELDYRSDSNESEISGVGHDDATTDIDAAQTYQFDGTQDWGIADITQYNRTTGGWQTLQATLDDYTGSKQYITIAHDNDSSSNTDDYFRDIRVRKNATTEPTSASWGAQETAPNSSGSRRTSSNYAIQRDSLNTGGIDTASSNNYAMRDTVGEQATGEVSSSNFQIQAGYRQMAATSIAISDAPNVTMSSIGGVTGGASQATSTWTVTTDNPAGYELTINASTAPALQASSTGASFADYTPSGDPDYAFSIASTESAFGFTPEGSDITDRFKDNGTSCNAGTQDTSAACWDGLSTTTQVIANSGSNNQPAGTDTTVRFRAESGTDHIQPAGTYQATITVTATAL